MDNSFRWLTFSFAEERKIRHFWSSELWFAGGDPGQDMRHVDFMWPLWSMFDTTPEGRGKSWSPQIKY